jgi:hypothetical protein
MRRRFGAAGSDVPGGAAGVFLEPGDDVRESGTRPLTLPPR